MKIILWILICLLAPLFAMSQLKTEAQYISVGGMERYYELFVPENHHEKTMPVVFVLHGGGGTARGMIRHTKGRFNTLARRNGFIVVYPNGYEKGWNDSTRDTFSLARKLNIDDVGFFKAMLKDLDEKLNIDHENIFVCGISNGGFMAQRLAFELSDKIKGIGVVAANLSVAQSKMFAPANPVSLMFICGTHDPLVPYKGGNVTVFRQKRGKVLSVAESIDFWKEINGCTTLSEECFIKNVNPEDKCQAQKIVWENPADKNIRVVDIKVINGGHTWPGCKAYLPKRIIGNTNRDFNGCDEIWDFFKSLN